PFCLFSSFPTRRSSDLAAFIFDLFVMIFAMFYFFRDGERILDNVRRILPFDAEHRDAMLKQARELISASVASSLLVAAVQGALRSEEHTSELQSRGHLV